MTRCLVTAAILALGGAAGIEGQIPDSYTNLKVLPADISRDELVGFMRNFAVSLGVRCSYCHVGEPQAPLSTYDFASDEKATKEKARVMLRMVEAINAEHLPELPDRVVPRVEANCGTCHRGITVPRTLTEIISHTAVSFGADSAVQQYGALRDSYFGSGSYDFGESSLNDAAALVPDPAVRIALLALNLEFFPVSVGAHVAMGGAQAEVGDTTAAVGHLERALELSPNAQFIQQLLHRLRGN